MVCAFSNHVSTRIGTRSVHILFAFSVSYEIHTPTCMRPWHWNLCILARLYGSFCDNPHLLDEPCQADRTCAQGLFCDFTVGKCAKKRTEGAACEMGNECADGLTCSPDKDLGFTCHKIPAASEPCYDTCGEGLFCKNVSAEGICLTGICSLLISTKVPELQLGFLFGLKNLNGQEADARYMGLQAAYRF
jgi:hypothetical protein